MSKGKLILVIHPNIVTLDLCQVEWKLKKLEQVRELQCYLAVSPTKL